MLIVNKIYLLSEAVNKGLANIELAGLSAKAIRKGESSFLDVSMGLFVSAETDLQPRKLLELKWLLLLSLLWVSSISYLGIFIWKTFLIYYFFLFTLISLFFLISWGSGLVLVCFSLGKYWLGQFFILFRCFSWSLTFKNDYLSMMY